MKLTTEYTKEVPGQEDYSSEGFGASIEAEVPGDQTQDACPSRKLRTTSILSLCGQFSRVLR